MEKIKEDEEDEEKDITNKKKGWDENGKIRHQNESRKKTPKTTKLSI